MATKVSKVITAASLLAFCGFASAYTISGTVSDNQGNGLEGVSVDLLKEGKSTTTDNQVKFLGWIHQGQISV